MPITRLAEYVAAQRGASLPPEVVHHAHRAIIDWVAAAVPGGLMPPAQTLGRALLGHLGHGGSGSDEAGPATLVPSGRGAPLRTAALINATAAHSAEVDDIFRDGIYHPGAPTIAAALAAAQVADASGHALVNAVVAGYEASTRVAAAVNPAHYRFWHTTGTVGTLGAAAAVACLRGLDADATAHALANATTMAAALQQAFRSEAMSKPLHAGHAAEAGALAALGAAEGLTGALDVLDGPRGFGAAMSDNPDWDAALADLGSVWNITRMTFKNHAACGHTFAPIDATLELAQRARLDAADVERIEVETAAVPAEVAGNPDPKTGFEAQFSIQYCVAVALTLGSVRLRAFDDDVLSDRGVRDLLGRVTVTVAPDLDATFPRQRAARVAITTVDGRLLRAEALTRKGDPDAPLSDDELADKYRELTTPVLGDGRADALGEQLWTLDTLGSVRDLDLAPAQHATTGAAAGGGRD